MKLKVCNIQDYSIHDGPGIRTTVFLAGCPLKCKWCHNPETQDYNQTILYESKRCIKCGSCFTLPCGCHGMSEKGHIFNREMCSNCGDCIEVCPSSALRYSYKTMDIEEVAEKVNKYKSFYGDNGGITFSGGEPLCQWDGIRSICEITDIPVAIDTCGYVPQDVFCDMLKYASYVLFDLKLYDDELHKKYTGVSSEIILQNFDVLKKSGVDFCVRTPLIPNITDTKENLNALRKLTDGCKHDTLPYNKLAPQKYEWLGRKYELTV